AMSAALISLPIIAFLLCQSGWVGRPPPRATARNALRADVRGRAGYRSSRHPHGLHLVRREVQEPAVAALEVGGRVVLGRDREVNVAVDVVQHGLHERAAAGEEEILGVRPAGTRAHADPAAAGDPYPPDQDVIAFR